MWRLSKGWCQNIIFERMGVWAAVTTCALGDMKQPANFSSALTRAGLDPSYWAGGAQVHGRQVRAVQRLSGPKVFSSTDGMITNTPGLLLRILTADCVPVFVADPVAKAIALVHAGRRGVQKQILKRAIDLLIKKYRAQLCRMHVTLGPHIQACCYKVHEDVACDFQQYRKAVAPYKKDKHGAMQYSLDLAECLRQQAQQAGLAGKRFSAATPCTAHHKRFFSYYRTKTEKRTAAVMMIKG